MHPDELAFLAKIRENPADDMTRLVYADWLEENGDLRGGFLRLECELSRVYLRLLELRKVVPAEWATAASPLYQVVFESVAEEQRIACIKVIRIHTARDLYRARDIVKTPGSVISTGLSIESAITLAKQFDRVATVRVERMEA
jgi:uncharacterized protein (TIGR02996 family)